MKGLSVEAARAAMLASVTAPEVETVALEAAAGRVLAEPVTAVRDQPPFDASAMDGWAIRHADAASGPARLAIVGESAAGRGFEGRLEAGQAVRIFTGAPVPEGADTVVIQEEATREGEVVSLGPAEAGRNIRRRGGDFREGQALLAAGKKLRPWRLSLAASAGRAELKVAARPRVAVLSTGEELVPAGAPIAPHQIFNSGGPTLSALIRAWGGIAEHLSPTGDDADAIAAALASVEADLLVTIGGASVGDYDLVKPALGRLGLEIQVPSINLRPGKPTWFGVLGDGRKVLGLPGNPASALVAAELFLRPLLAAMQGADPRPALIPVRLTAPLPANGPREHWMRARLGVDAQGMTVTAFGDQDSSLVTVMAEADALLRRAPDCPAAAAGDLVEVLFAAR